MRRKTDYRHKRNITDSASINIINITREENRPYGYFKRQTSEISHVKTWTWLRKGNLKRETESLLIATQNNALRTNNICCILTFWPGQKCHSKVMHRKEVTHSNGSYERKSRGRKLADEMGRAKKNSHGTLIAWCTGREWLLNCMTVISAWWRLNIRFQRSSGRRTII